MDACPSMINVTRLTSIASKSLWAQQNAIRGALLASEQLKSEAELSWRSLGYLQARVSKMEVIVDDSEKEGYFSMNCNMPPEMVKITARPQNLRIGI
jgi:hypothetical protein